MNFPSFGDAAVYDELGRACAAALAGRGGTVFDACYHPVRPPGAALLMAAPYLVTRDPVDADYIALGLNLAFFALAVAAIGVLLGRDAALLPGRPWRLRALWAITFVVLLLNAIPHIPVRLADLPSLALFLAGVVAGGAVLVRPTAHRIRSYGAAGLLCAAAVLTKISHLPAALVLLGALLVIDREARGRSVRLGCAAMFMAGLSPVLLQFANVWAHTGRPWLYDAAYIDTNFSHGPRRPSIEAVVYTIPAQGAYMVRVTEPIDYATFLAAKLHRGLFGFEWAVYMGEPSRGPWWTPRVSELVLAWALVLGYFALSAWVAWAGPPSLRLLNAVAAPTALITAVTVHTELRYYALPRAVLWVTIACLALQGWQRWRRPGP